MSRLPAARLGSLHDDEPSFHAIEVDFQAAAASKFEFAWPAASRAEQHPPSLPSEETDSTPTHSQDEAAPAAPPPPQSESRLSTPSVPRLSRAFSMPLPSQIGHFQHPGRTPGSGSPPTPTAAVHQFQELSLELADSLQMAIQTLLQLSPPQLFDPAKEQLSSCAVQVPTTSISALLTSMKNLNYMSANIHRFGSPVHDAESPAVPSDAVPKDDFDVGELLQSVGDSLGGVAADSEVDLVLHHGDAGIKHIGVKGDECGISYALTHIIHQVLITTRRGDSIEVGLSITGEPMPTSKDAASSSPSSSRRTSMSSAASESPVLDDEGPVVCTFDIAHRFFSSSVEALSPNDPNEEPPPESADAETRPEPQFDTAILRRLLRHIGGTIRPSLQPRLFSTGRRCELALTLERGLPLSTLHERTPSLEDEMAPHPHPNVPLAREPTLEELTSFSETLRGKKVAFHASSQGSFAHHLTRYLTAWGMDISHVPTDGAEETDPAEDAPIVRAESVFGGSSGSSQGLGIGLPTVDVVPPIVDVVGDPPEEIKAPPSDAGLSFVIIDDDVVALRRRLLQHRAEVVPNLHLHPRKQRPSLAANHRPRSSPSIRHTLLSAGHGMASPPAAFLPVPIVHFTSLANYKLVKDALQGVLPGPAQLLPEVIVIPKPAGPRRLLTALHTAVYKPVVDPFFSPIATSPMSPSGSAAPFMSSRKSTSNTSNASNAAPARSDPPRASRSPADPPASSPLALKEGLEYFSDAAVKQQLGGNAASGLVIQSPDGRPAGIFFQPQSRTSSSKSNVSLATMERDPPWRGSGARRASVAGTSSANATPTNGTLTPSSAHADKPVPVRPPAEILHSFRGKGRVAGAAAATPERSEKRALSSAAWREATQNLARHALAPSAAASPAPVVPLPDIVPPHKTSPVSRSSSGPPSPEARKTVARRATQGPKSPITSAGMKKSKTMGNNIVPPISVLIVEDNAINQTILSTFMRRNKIKYEVAWNGREAVEKWRHGNFHLILMDIQMPVMDGIEATKEIRRLEKESGGPFPPSPGARSAESPGSHPSSSAASTPFRSPSSTSSTPFRSQVIIVALTASSLQSDRVAALAAGCNDFLTKPVTNSWLNDKVIEWGSIKALQMWAELRPEVARNISVDQEAQAQAVANKLHVPPASTRRSPLSGPMSVIGQGSREAIVSPTDRTDKPARRSSEHGSSSSGSSPEPSPISSDDEAAQDPITEPPAVIETPELETIELPEDPQAVTGEAALLNFLEEESKDRGKRRPTLLGQRAASNLTSIASVMHDTPGVGGTQTDGLAAAGAATRDTAPPPQPPKGDDEKPAGH